MADDGVVGGVEEPRSMSNRLLLTVEFNVTLLQELAGLVPIQRQIPMFWRRAEDMQRPLIQSVGQRSSLHHVLCAILGLSVKLGTKKNNIFNEIGGSHNR